MIQGFDAVLNLPRGVEFGQFPPGAEPDAALKLVFLLRGINLLLGIEWFQLEDGSAVIAGNPERRWRRGAVDKRSSDCRFAWEQIFDDLASGRIEAHDVVAADP